ncbi:putative ferric-chelate reductase 1 isoform X1 [Micropterus dolomieu]|uniref:putative ferric-chelate reductase 1 isoform X1 n=1 Tax=Micropterus dolomieu TaxID=147949 RepID=UPI001E8EBE36|nr:putative ferric-chelate reductase 1 isoform X1 [Micropterus dolomieu]
MERGLILLVAALMVYVAPGVQGTFSFANNTEQVNITMAGCGVTKLCVETPLNCDPTGNNSCLFVSVVASKSVAPTDLSFELRGDSTGYIAVGLTAKPSEATTMLFICAPDGQNRTFLFQTMQRNNTDALLTPTEMNVTNIQGTVTGNVIQCKFTVPNMNATTYSILLGTGHFDGKTFGHFNISLDSGALNLTNPVRNTADPHSTATTHSGSTTTTDPHSTATTHAGNSGAVHALDVLLLLSVVALSMLGA